MISNFKAHLFDESPWRGISVDFRCDRYYGRGKGCSKCGKEHVQVTQDVSLQRIAGLAVSLLDEGTQTFITGFDLISEDVGTANILFGYRVPGRQVTMELHGQQLRGFTIFAGDGGIHAIRPIFNTKVSASWIGQPEGEKECISTQLNQEADVKGILGKFDVSHVSPLLRTGRI
jgi:hypothetical protein